MSIDPKNQVYRYQLLYTPSITREVELTKWRDIFKVAKPQLQEHLKVFITNNQTLYSPTVTPTMGIILGVFEDEGNCHTITLEERAVLKAGEAEYNCLIGRFLKMMLKQ